MPNKTLLQLRQDARRAAGLTQDADAVGDLTVNTYINEAYHELYDLIIDADDARLFAKNATDLVKVGTPGGDGRFSYRVPFNLYRLISCHVRRGEYYVPAVRADPSEYAQLADDCHELGQPKYFLRWHIDTGERFLFIFPEPATNSIAITYFPQPKELSEDSDQIDNPSSWLSFVSYGAAIKMLNQLERDTSAQLLELRKLGQRIEDSVNDMDMNSVATVRDVGGDW